MSDCLAMEDARSRAGGLLVQSREPPSIWVFGRGQIPLPGASRRDSGQFSMLPPAT